MQRRVKKFFTRLLISYLLIGVFPLVIIGPLTYSLVRNILMERVRETTVEVTDRAFTQLQSLLNDGVIILDAIATDQAFISLFEAQITQERQTSLYNSLFLLLTGRNLKPSVHVVSLDGEVRLNSMQTPPEYYLEPYRNWGVLRKAFIANGEPVLYLHTGHDELNRVLSLARYIKQGAFEGFIILDVDHPQFSAALETTRAAHFPFLAILDQHKTSSRALNGIFDEGILDVIRKYPQSTLIPLSSYDGNRFLFHLKTDTVLSF